MSDRADGPLSRSARALIEETRGLDGPDPQDKERVRRALLATVGSGAGLATGGAASAAAEASSAGGIASTVGGSGVAGGVPLGLKIAAVVLIGSAVGGTVMLTSAPDDSRSLPARESEARAPANRDRDVVAEPAVLSPARTAEREAEVTTGPEPRALEAPPETPSVAARRVRRAPARLNEPRAGGAVDSTLPQEVALLREAHRAMSSGDVDRALGALAAHAREFPSGALEEEREAARVLALCQGGRDAEAHALARRFLRARPSSPHRARLQAACPVPSAH